MTKTVLFGASKYIIPTIKILNEFTDLALVVTTEQDDNDAIPVYCKTNSIPYQSVKTLKDKEIIKTIKNTSAKVGVLGYFGLIVPEELLSVFPKGIINIHPSLLPYYRGPTPVQTAILNGDQQTGVSIILLDNDVDHGPILSQEKEIINIDDTTDSMHKKLFIKGANLIKKILPEYINGKLTPTVQNHNKATFTNHLSRSDAQIDLERPPNKEILDRMIRAYFPWPGVWTKIRFKNQELRIKLLPEKTIQVEGGKPMSYKDFINGYPNLNEKMKSLLSS